MNLSLLAIQDLVPSLKISNLQATSTKLWRIRLNIADLGKMKNYTSCWTYFPLSNCLAHVKILLEHLNL